MHLNDPVPTLPPDIEIPEYLRQIIKRCLAKEKEQRFSSMKELADELAKVPVLV
jgi:hypothetical protein